MKPADYGWYVPQWDIWCSDIHQGAVEQLPVPKSLSQWWNNLMFIKLTAGEITDRVFNILGVILR